MGLTWPQDNNKKQEPINLGGWFATFGANVATLKYYCFDEIHIVGWKVNLKSHLKFFSSSVHLSSFSFFLVELLHLFVNEW
jgi:hypothetical protein